MSTTRSLIASLTSLLAVILMNMPAINPYYNITASNKLSFTIGLFVMLFVAHTVIDLIITAPCHMFDSAMLAIFGLMGYGLYELIKMMPFFGFIESIPIADMILSGLFVAVPVFIWKRIIRMIIIGNAC